MHFSADMCELANIDACMASSLLITELHELTSRIFEEICDLST